MELEVEKKKILVVGAGGFTGGFIVEESLERGYDVYAGVRENTSRRYLGDARLKFAVFDYDSPETLEESVKQALPESGKWDYIIYNLGATKSLDFTGFDRINHDYLLWFVSALRNLSALPDKFLYMSSLSVMGKGDEKGYTPFIEKDIPNPDTRYGTSKLKAETLLQSAEDIPWIIFRATGIYGPREKDYFLMFKSIAKGFDFSVGYKKQELTFIYVKDLARAILDAIEKSASRRLYIISEERSYTQKEFRKISADVLHKRFVIPVKAPLWILKLVCLIAGRIGAMRGKPATLNPDKYRIMKQRNWRADVSAAKEGFGFSPRVSLEDGVKESIKWYKDNGWL